MAYTWNISPSLYPTPFSDIDNNLVQAKDIIDLTSSIQELDITNRCTVNFYTVQSIFHTSMYDVDFDLAESSYNSLDKKARFSIEFHANHQSEWALGI